MRHAATPTQAMHRTKEVKVKVKVNQPASSPAGGSRPHTHLSNLKYSPTYVRTRIHRTAGRGAPRTTLCEYSPTLDLYIAIPTGQAARPRTQLHKTQTQKTVRQTSRACRGVITYGRCAYIYTVCVCLSAVLGRVVRKSIGGRMSPSGTGKAVSQAGR